jgi:rhodanese-related sulfurtransferase
LTAGAFFCMLAALFILMICMRSFSVPMPEYTYVSVKSWFHSLVSNARCLSLLLLATLLFSYQGSAQQSDISVEEFQAGTNKANVQILDVRTLDEYNSGHIAGSLLADWTLREEFNRRVTSLDKNRPVYVYCLSGGRSRAAVEQLRKAGFKEVYNLEGGMVAWKKAAKPIEGVARSRQMTMEEYRAQIPADQTVLVDIGAVWCPPCRKMDPVLKDLVQSKGASFKLVQIDGGVQETLAQQLNAHSFPTFIIYKNGKEVWRQEGIVSKEELLKQLL